MSNNRKGIIAYIFSILTWLHESITSMMARSWIVENVLIAKARDPKTGEYYDCIYCTILRNAVLFFIIGYISR